MNKPLLINGELVKPACEHPASRVFISDYDTPLFPEDGEPVVTVTNRHCCSCNTHWHGRPGQVKEYTPAEWDQYLNTYQGETP